MLAAVSAKKWGRLKISFALPVALICSFVSFADSVLAANTDNKDDENTASDTGDHLTAIDFTVLEIRSASG